MSILRRSMCFCSPSLCFSGLALDNAQWPSKHPSGCCTYWDGGRWLGQLLCKPFPVQVVMLQVRLFHWLSHSAGRSSARCWGHDHGRIRRGFQPQEAWTLARVGICSSNDNMTQHRVTRSRPKVLWEHRGQSSGRLPIRRSIWIGSWREEGSEKLSF